MGNRCEQDLRYLQLCFIGKIIAGFTHEIKNHLAIIKESAGLIGDLIKFGKKGKDESAQYLEIIGSVEDQMERTVELFNYLNRFAHRMDMQTAVFNVNDSLEELVALVNRFAHQRKITLEKEFQRDLPPIKNDPPLFQFLVFCLIENTLMALDKNSKIVLKTSVSADRILVSIVPKGNFIESQQGPCSREIQDDVIKQLGGSIERDSEGTVIALVSMS